MNTSRPLSELFQVRARFRRSVNIVADQSDPNALVEYIVSPLGKSVLRRIGQGFKAGSQARAWSIVGPYGAGKSAFALFLGKVLGLPVDMGARERLRMLAPHTYSELHGQIPTLSESGFLFVPILGSREPLSLALLRGLTASLTPVLKAGDVEADRFASHLKSLYHGLEQGGSLSAAVLCETVESAARLARNSSLRACGLLIVIDELGKLLEYAALHPEQGDVFLLQALAEAASRSGDNVLGVVVILHQAFERYAARLSQTQQREWAKVQGRFEDIGFLESSGEMLKLLGAVIEPKASLDGLAKSISYEVSKAGELQLAPRELKWSDAEDALKRSAPLHPTVSLLLGKLFRSQLAQNERSLFAFLTSGEPCGFQEYLAEEVWYGDARRPFYRLDRLYDYVSTAMGSALYALPQRRRWAEIEDALERLPGAAGALEASLTKAIGLLGLLGDQRYLRASRDVLIYALSDGASMTPDAIAAGIDRLVAWNITIYRRHKDAYGLWEGSDVDLEERFQQGLQDADSRSSLASLLEARGQFKPYVAKRHLYETGTLRYFSPWVIDEGRLDQVRERPFETADGAVVFVLATDPLPSSELMDAVEDFSRQLPSPRREQLLFGVLQDTYTLRQAAVEVLAWEWVSNHTPELEGDSVARKELAVRQIEAEAQLARLCSVSFDRISGAESWQWLHAGNHLNLRNAAQFSSTLSDICDHVYHAAPIVRNELVNRRMLSSAAAAGRRNLLERMVTHGTEPRLGIVGFPPELSMYRSVLESSGLHHPGYTGWQFGPHPERSKNKAGPLWDAIDAFLDTTENGKRCVTELLDILREPPYGVKDGLLPIYLAVALLQWETEIALYENGSFVPKLDIAILERLVKSPAQFHLRRYRLGEARAFLFERYSTLLGRNWASQNEATLLTAVRPLLAFVRQLPPYTLNTRSVSSEAVAVREAILSAKEPQRLLFEDLPAAVKREVILPDTEVEAAQEFFSAVRKALLELQRAYDELLGAIQTQLYQAMRLPSQTASARQEAFQRAALLMEHVTDLRLVAFVTRLADRQLPDQEWLESVASTLAGKPPKQWNDGDVLRFGIELAEMSGRFKRVEDILFEAGSSRTERDGARLLRLGVTSQSGEEQRDVISILPEDADEIANLIGALDQTLQVTTSSSRIRLAALAELARRCIASQPQISQGDSHEQ
jgi:hypothetical protein